MRRGQALVEFALVLPILLLLILGGVQVGLALVMRYELVHAAIQGADAGALAWPPFRRCPTALSTLAAVLGRAPDNASCNQSRNLVTVSAELDLPLIIPIGGRVWRISVVERSQIP